MTNPEKFSKFLFICFPYEANNEIHGFKYDAINRYSQNKVDKVARGGIFGGPNGDFGNYNLGALTQVEINNNKVQDFRSRTIKTLAPSSIQIESILSQEGESLIQSSFNRNILKTLSKNKSFIYDIFHTYNSDNSITINFKLGSCPV